MSQYLENKIANFLLQHYGEEHFTPGLDRISLALQEPLKIIKQYQAQKKLKIIIIAGTNGKGETTYELEKLLNEKGQKTARWISPHILSVAERISFNSKDIDLLKLEEMVKRAHQLVLCHHYHLSFYEFLFFVFCLEVRERIDQLDVLLLEVGLGGRLDAVNIFDADLVGLPSISRDHENILGKGYKNILREKMGVVRKNSVLISCLELQYCRELVEQYELPYAWDLFALKIVAPSDDYTCRNKKLALALFVQSQNKTLEIGATFLKKEIATRYQAGNRFPLGAKGRFEKVTGNERCFIFIGAHNIDGMRKMAAHSLLQQSGIDYIWCSFSKRPKKEILLSLRILQNMMGQGKSVPLYLSPFIHPKAEKEETLAEVCLEIQDCGHQEIYFRPDKKELLFEFKKGSTILVTGSYYFVGEIQKILLSQSQS